MFLPSVCLSTFALYFPKLQFPKKSDIILTRQYFFSLHFFFENVNKSPVTQQNEETLNTKIKANYLNHKKWKIVSQDRFISVIALRVVTDNAQTKDWTKLQL